MGPRVADAARDPRRKRHLRCVGIGPGLTGDLTSAAVPPPGPEDHARGEGETLIVYADLACPHCAAAWAEICERPARIVFRHFPVTSKHPRAPVLHAAAEAAGRQERFFEMVESLYADRGRVDDPHLWERAGSFDLDLERFEADRRSQEVAARVRRDFESGIRAGVTGTPATFPVGADLPPSWRSPVSRVLRHQGGFRCPTGTQQRFAAR